jgi:hypothetical protein
MRTMKASTKACFVLLMLAGVAACGADDPVGVEGEWIVVQVSTTGQDVPEADFTVVVNPEGRTETIEANGSVSLDVDTGSYTLELTGLPSNCAVELPEVSSPSDSQNPTTVEVATSEIELVRWNVACEAAGGA